MKPTGSPPVGFSAADADLRQRLRGLKPKQAEQLKQVMRDISRGDLLMAGQWLLQLAQSDPDHPEVLRWRGARHMATGEWAEAAACLARSAELRPGDLAVLIPLAQAQEQTGDHDASRRTLQAAMASVRDPQQWLPLSIECDRQGHIELAFDTVNRALAATPGDPRALLQRARCQHSLGMAEGAAADCRTLIKAGQLEARAWFTLLDLKTVRLDAAELEQLRQAAASPSFGSADRQLLDFALGKALEDAGEHPAALQALQRANDSARPLHPWDSAAFERRVQSVRQAFDAALPSAVPELGHEVIFLVGLPRSGTTLVEQVLASHSRVEGASELPYLDQVIAEESRRRGQAFPLWVGRADSADWARMGQRYLALTQRWRELRPVATDKLPENWLLAGAALQMLPQARVIDCRRDALETCWSCYKQLFGPQKVGFTYGFDTLAHYWQQYDALCRFWAARFPARFRAQSYEALVHEPEAQIRELLEFCGLPFEDPCLHFHTAQRAIRTPSALQVRQPLKRVSTPAARYGELLDPLRTLLQPLPG
jgi:tetratricopeptide (TPR) repeat protein